MVNLSTSSNKKDIFLNRFIFYTSLRAKCDLNYAMKMKKPGSVILIFSNFNTQTFHNFS